MTSRNRTIPRLLLALSLGVASILGAAVNEVATPAEAVDQFHGDSRIRLLNVWATWCRPCVVEMEDLREIDATFDDHELEIVGISLDDAIPGDRDEIKARVDRFLESRSIAFRNVYYTGLVDKLQEQLDFEGEIPITLLYDSTGKEIRRIQGRIKGEELTRDIRALLTASKD